MDDIVCISLKNSIERQEHSIAEARRMGIPFRFHLVEKHPEGGMVGCFMSHLEVIRDAYSRGIEKLMVLEDDFCATESYDETALTNALTFLQSTPDWERLQLGYVPLHNEYDVFGIIQFMMAPQVHPSIIRFSGLAAHAYCLSRKGMQRLLEGTDRYLSHHVPVHIDKLFNAILIPHGQSYCTAPFIIDQRWCFPTSNIPQSQLEYLFRQFQCKCEEYKIFYRLSLLHPYRIHIACIFILFVVLLCYLASSRLKH